MEQHRAFLEDLTDGIAVAGDGVKSVRDLVDSEAVRASLAFHTAWRSVWGVAPQRSVVCEFAEKLMMPADWKELLQGSMLVHSPLRVHPQRQQLHQRAVQKYQMTIDRIGARGRPEVMELMVEKLRARFAAVGGSESAAAEILDGAGLIREYKRLVAGDQAIALLERWAGVSPRPEATYYERMSDPRIQERFNNWSWLTDMFVRGDDAEAEARRPRSALEMLQGPMMRDLYLWRSDAGGVLVVDDGGAALESMRRTPRDMPIELVAMALPASAGPYATIVVPEESREIFGVDREGIVSVSRQAPFATFANAGQLKQAWSVPVPGQSAVGDAVGEGMVETILSGRSRFANAEQHAGFCQFQQYVSRVAAQQGLLQRSFETDDGTAADALGTILVCDTRQNWWSLLCLLVTLSHLDARRWRVAFFCGADNEAWARRELLPRVPRARIAKWDLVRKKSKKSFTMDDYNQMMTSEALWEHEALEGASGDHVLTIQDDGAITRRGLEDDAEMLSFDYVGAPWTPSQENAKSLRDAGVGADLVGNGGISLRKRNAMIQAIRGSSPRQGPGAKSSVRRLFFHNLMPVPEDVFFSAAVAKCAPRAVAERFSYEECAPPPAGPPPYAFHKPWAYLPPSVLAEAGLA